mgnify:CR=1 FL=1
MYTHGSGRRTITWLNKVVLAHSGRQLTGLRSIWDDKTGRAFNEKEWSGALAYLNKVLRNACFRYIQFNILHRVYLAPQVLNKIFPGLDASCPRCCYPTASFWHMLWECQEIIPFWREVLIILANISGRPQLDGIVVCLLGMFPRPKKFCTVWRFFDLAILLAKRAITMRWKSHTSPEASQWKLEVIRWATRESNALKLEERRSVRKRQVSHIWDELLNKITKYGEVVTDSN